MLYGTLMQPETSWGFEWMLLQRRICVARVRRVGKTWGRREGLSAARVCSSGNAKLTRNRASAAY